MAGDEIDRIHLRMTSERQRRNGSPLFRRVRRAAAVVLLITIAITLLWWTWGRVSASDRRLTVHTAPDVASVPVGVDSGPVRVLAWNIAHGRGNVGPHPLRNWRGSASERDTRLRRIAGILRNVDADVVVLNEVDFDAAWSDGVNQAKFLAEAAGYPIRVEQRNFDFRAPFLRFGFGNAVLSRLPVEEVRWVELPAHSALEQLVAGSKEGVLVRLRTADGAIGVVAVHLEYRGEETRLAAVPVFDSVARAWAAPLVLAGDFNTAPPGWPFVGRPTALGDLMELGWRSPRAEGAPAVDELTFPTYSPAESRDWILAEPPLRIVESRVVHAAADLSDHAPVVARVEFVELDR